MGHREDGTTVQVHVGTQNCILLRYIYIYIYIYIQSTLLRLISQMIIGTFSTTSVIELCDVNGRDVTVYLVSIFENCFQE